MKTFAKFQVLGVIGNIEKVEFENGSLLNISLAVNETYTKDQQTIEKTHWLDMVAFGEKRVSYIEKYFKVGQRVLTSGIIGTNVWDKDGEKRKKTTFRMLEITQTSIPSAKEEIEAETEELPF